MLSRNSTVAFHGAPETNIHFEIWMRLTPSTRGPKFLMKTSFSGHFIKHVEEEASLFLADENMKWHHNPPDSIQSHLDNPQTPPRHLPDTLQTPQYMPRFDQSEATGRKEKS